MAAIPRQAPPICGQHRPALPSDQTTSPPSHCGHGTCRGRAASSSSTKVPAALTGRRTMKTVSGLFETDAQAKDAVAALEDAGIASGEISLVSRDGKAGSDAAEGVGIGSAVGGIGGLLAGLGAFAIPGIGPVVGAGWLATTVLGAAAGGVAGGLIGALTEAGVE